MNNYLYSLEKHRNGKRKYNCPDCSENTFVRYINNKTNDYLHDNVGRCDRQDGCGYHYSPKEYFRDNNIADNNYHNTYDKTYLQTRTAVPCTSGTNSTNQDKPKVYTIPFEYIEQAAKTRNSTFIEYLFNLFEWETICDTVDKYFIGCTKDRAVVFPQIDAEGKVRTAKIQQYNPETGKRIKDQPNCIGWVHAKLKNKGLLPDNYELKMCLFGEHLIRSKRYKDMSVGIVESEKSALIASACMPKIIWMAVGALEWLNVDKLKPLKGRKVILFPDTSTTGYAFKKWNKIAKEAKQAGFNISVSTLLENSCTDEEKAKGYDLGDYLIDRTVKAKQATKTEEMATDKPIEKQTQSANLSDMVKVNPVLGELIERFDCVEVNTAIN